MSLSQSSIPVILCIFITVMLFLQRERKKKQIAGGKIKSWLVGLLISKSLVMITIVP